MRTTALSLALCLAAGSVEAFPRFQLSSGMATCQDCHHAPAGGGLLNEFGRDQSEDPLSGGGNGGLLHGLIDPPRWLTVGGDVRLAALANDVGGPEGVELAAFPMQADLGVRVGTDVLSATVTVGLRGSVRSAPEGAPDEAWSRFVSREHSVTFRPADTALYVRGGRFALPFGLRLADHTAWVRRGLDLALEQEPYALSGGWVSEEWELHLTAYARDPFGAGGAEELGGAALAEVRVGELVLGLSARYGGADTNRRGVLGALAKWWWEDPQLLWMVELDAVDQRFGGALPSRRQLVAYAGPVWMPVRALSLGAAYELFAEDLSLPAANRHAVGAWVSYLPWAHVELMLSTRWQRVGTDDHAWNLLAQLHYYL